MGTGESLPPAPFAAATMICVVSQIQKTRPSFKGMGLVCLVVCACKLYCGWHMVAGECSPGEAYPHTQYQEGSWRPWKGFGGANHVPHIQTPRQSYAEIACRDGSAARMRYTVQGPSRIRRRTRCQAMTRPATRSRSQWRSFQPRQFWARWPKASRQPAALHSAAAAAVTSMRPGERNGIHRRQGSGQPGALVPCRGSKRTIMGRSCL